MSIFGFWAQRRKRVRAIFFGEGYRHCEADVAAYLQLEADRLRFQEAHGALGTVNELLKDIADGKHRGAAGD